jgi:hypothetical protein
VQCPEIRLSPTLPSIRLRRPREQQLHCCKSYPLLLSSPSHPFNILNTPSSRKPSHTAVSAATASPPTPQSTPRPCRTSSAPKPITNASTPAAIPPVNPDAALPTPAALKTRPVSTSPLPLPRPWLLLAPPPAMSFRPVGLLVRLPVVSLLR